MRRPGRRLGRAGRSVGVALSPNVSRLDALDINLAKDLGRPHVERGADLKIDRPAALVIPTALEFREGRSLEGSDGG